MSFGPGQPRLLVKVCGITSAGDAHAAVAAGADALGFVFWPRSSRAVSPDRAAAIARELPSGVAKVGVFVQEDEETLARVADAVGLDLLQLVGPEPPEAFPGLPRPALKVLRVSPEFRAEDALPFASRAAGVLLDTYHREVRGGTGAAFDWSRALGLRDRLPFLVLAGGLNPENVAQAVVQVRPHAVDVSSGVEASPGRKDARKVRAFVEAARAAREEVP